MKKKRKNLYLSKETIAMLTAGSGTMVPSDDAPESTLPACTSICSICPDTTDPGTGR